MSRISQLRGRGLLSNEDVAAFSDLSVTDLTEQLESEDAVERSTAIRILARRGEPAASVNLSWRKYSSGKPSSTPRSSSVKPCKSEATKQHLC